MLDIARIGSLEGLLGIISLSVNSEYTYQIISYPKTSAHWRLACQMAGPESVFR